MTPCVVVKKGRAKPFFLQHPWVFSGAVERLEGDPAQGAVVRVTDCRGQFIALGFFNPSSQIRVRLFHWREEQAITPEFWKARVERALRLRTDTLRLPETANAFRLIYSEADGLPGLIVDRYGDYLVVQWLTAGMAAQREPVLDALEASLHPRGILERPDDEMMDMEGVALPRGTARGVAPDGPVEVQCDGLRFLADLLHGQKTGAFLDQRENRAAVARYARGRAVLDVFTYTGGFALAAARGGAVSALGVDRSAPALEIARRNAELNGATNVTFETGQAAPTLRALREAGRRFGMVILDPPKFAHSRQGLDRALRAYREINLLGLQLLDPEGILVTCSCSGLVAADAFLGVVNEAAVETDRRVQLLERRGAAADHPVSTAFPEGDYLKCLIARVTEA